LNPLRELICNRFPKFWSFDYSFLSMWFYNHALWD